MEAEEYGNFFSYLSDGKISASKDSLQYLIRLLLSKQLVCSLNIWNFYLYNNVVLAMTMPKEW